MNSEIYSDLYKNLTTNPEFHNKVTAKLKEIELADKAGNSEAAKQHVQELLYICDFNASLLVPFFFPKFPEFEPMTLWSRPHAFSMMALTLLGSCTIQASRQCGKCLDGNTKLTVRERGDKKEQTFTMAELFERSKCSKG